ncbi:hypothetical protein Lal_00010955 [Lupinus albus]|nr:hypothetical protein Lal_00010955 [Lupinus albus]
MRNKFHFHKHQNHKTIFKFAQNQHQIENTSSDFQIQSSVDYSILKFLYEGEVTISDMYIRVKRSKTTYFIKCKPSDKVLDIKEKLQELIDQPANDQRLVLPGTREVLEDSKTLAEQKVENDAVVALTLRKDDNEFEEVIIVRPNDFYQSRDGDGGNW